MKTDIVFAAGKEEKFAELGRGLGFERLIFVYENLNDIKKIESSLKIDYAILIKEKNKKNLVRKINRIKQKGFLVLVEAVDDDFDRFVLEKTQAEMIFGLERVHKKDAMHYRRSGLDQVLCKILSEKKKTVVFSLKDALEPLVLGRMIQNLKFCKKYKVKFIFGSLAQEPEEMKAAHDLSLFLIRLQQKFL